MYFWGRVFDIEKRLDHQKTASMKLNNTVHDLKVDVNSKTKHISSLQSKVHKFEKDLFQCRAQLNDNVQYAWTNTVRMFGLPQVKADDHEDVYKVVLSLFQEKLKEALATILTQKIISFGNW